MKRIISLSLVLVFFAIPVIGCGQDTDTSPKSVTDTYSRETPLNEKISIVATIFAPFDFARAITGDKAEVIMLVPPAAESHSFEPTPQDIIRIQNSDVFIYNGGNSDAWVDGILASMDKSKMNIVKFIDCVEVVEEEIVEGMEEDEHDDDIEYEDESDHEPEIDEHVWTSPRNARLIVQRIADTICAADPDNSAVYKANTENYITRLNELDLKFQAVVDSAVRKTLVFGDRFPFRYFVDAYGLDYLAAFPGCSTETEPSAATVAFLIDKVKAEQIPVVFHAELSNAKMANTIAEESGAKVLEFHACHNISRDDFQTGKTYIEIMNANIEALKEALG